MTWKKLGPDWTPMAKVKTARPSEPHRGSSQTHHLDLDMPDEHTQPDKQEQGENGVLGQVVKQTDDHG